MNSVIHTDRIYESDSSSIRMKSLLLVPLMKEQMDSFIWTLKIDYKDDFLKRQLINQIRFPIRVEDMSKIIFDEIIDSKKIT